MARRPNAPNLSDFPIEPLGDFHVVKVLDWREHILEYMVRKMGRPIRHECKDLWILTSSAEDAMDIARLMQRGLLPLDITQSVARVVTAKRIPTFAAIVAEVPQDVALYFSGTDKVDDHSLLRELHPAPSNLSERLSWSSGRYMIRSGHGRYQAEITSAPNAFAKDLAKKREALMEAVGPGFDADLTYLNASPILAAILPSLTRPASEALAHWLGRLGTAEIDQLMIPAKGIRSDFPLNFVCFQSSGVNKHATFFLKVGDVRITDYEVSGLKIPETSGVAMNEAARNGSLMLSQIIDMPGAEMIRVLSLRKDAFSWCAMIEPTSVEISPRITDIPFEADDEVLRITEEGNQISGDLAAFLSPLGKERASFILYCTEDGNSGMDFDVTPWAPNGILAEVLLRNSTFSLNSSQTWNPTTFIGDLS